MVIGRKKKALVHIAKEDLHLDEKTYRKILKGQKIIIGLMAILRKKQ